MSGFWSSIGSKEKRERLTFLGGGAAAIVAALWAAFVYLHLPKGNSEDHNGGVSASSGGVAINGNVTNSTLNAASTSEVVFDCKYYAPHYMRDVQSHIVADNSGITVTQYQEKTYVRDYTTNENDRTKKSYYRKNRSEISWGNQFSTGGKLVLIESFIDRKTGIIKNTVDETGNNSTEIGRCTESTP